MSNRRTHENIREFNNGNITFRLSSEDLIKIQEGKISDIEAIAWTLDELDCYLVGEQFCLSNYSMGVLVYNAYSSLCYILDFSDIAPVLLKGKRIRLYAKSPDEDDWNVIEREMGA